LFGFEAAVRFVWYFVPKGLDPVEFLDSAAVQALDLRLIAQDERPTVGLPGETVEAIGEGEVAVLGAGN